MLKKQFVSDIAFIASKKMAFVDDEQFYRIKKVRRSPEHCLCFFWGCDGDVALVNQFPVDSTET